MTRVFGIKFFKILFASEARTGVLLLVSCLLALMAANSSWSQAYESLIHYPLSLKAGGWELSHSLKHWVNDGLMVIFFFLVGLEIKKEMVTGELSSWKKAALPVFAALGGMVVPAALYLCFNFTGPAYKGWGIPMATDIAFAVGILSLLSHRVPVVLRVFLLALAIVDDLGAILVIAFFYSEKISLLFLTLSSLVTGLIVLSRLLKVKALGFYLAAGVVLWFFVLKSGVHATIAGVMLGLLTPAKVKNKEAGALREKIKILAHSGASDEDTLKINHFSQALCSPASRWIHWLHPYVNNFIMPVFAFFNAGVILPVGFSVEEFFWHPVSMGILLGLLVGKPLGVVLFSSMAVWCRWASWPAGFTRARLVGVGALAGIGFTMSLFLAGLSFNRDQILSDYSKISILIASAGAMLLGMFVLLFCDTGKSKKTDQDRVA